MIVTNFPDLPPDDELQSAKNCWCAGELKCVACDVHAHSRSRHLCNSCERKAWREGRLDQYPKMRLDGGKVYEDYLKLKRENPELTIAGAADRLGLNKTQLTNAVTRQRQKRGIKRVPGGQYVDWCG